MLKKISLPIVIASLLSACSTIQEPPTSSLSAPNLITAYDYLLFSQQKNVLGLEEMLTELVEADVVFIGEYHKNHASHLLQSQILSGLYKLNAEQGRDTILSMEMFERHHQSNLNDYLQSKVGEKYLIDESPAWDNYIGSYRPLVEFSKQNGIKVIAANAPADIVRCVGRQGEGYLSKLDNSQLSLIAKQPFSDIEGYAKKFYGLMGMSDHMPSNRMRNTYLAQLVRDNTMAESMTKANGKNTQIIHINGTFHSEDGLGTVSAFKRLNPELKVAVVTPIHFEKRQEAGKDSFYYVVQKQPKEFVSQEYQRKAYKKMFSESKSKTCIE